MASMTYFLLFMSNIAAFLAWWVLTSLIGVAAWPLTAKLFNRLPDKGYAFTKTLGLLGVGYLVWLLSSLGFLQLNAGGTTLASVIVLAIGLYSQRHNWRAAWHWLRENRNYVIAVEVVFFLTFALWAYVRALNPEITATEKPMELAFINAILRSPSMPPQDPWLSGFSISYYYFGYVIVAMLTQFSNLGGAVGFNLGLALTFGLVCVNAYGILHNLIDLTKRQDLGKIGRYAFPLLAPLFIMFGNLGGPLEVMHQRGMGSDAFWEWIDIPNLDTPAIQSESQWPDRYLWWWQSSRVIHDIDLQGQRSGLSPIDEFPMFSFVLGDLHPHVLTLPYALLAIGLALQIFLRKSEEDDDPHREINLTVAPDLDLMGRIAAYGLILGALSFLNTWDFPIYMFVVAAAGTIAALSKTGWTWRTLLNGVFLGFLIVVVGVILYLPFYLTFSSQAGGLMPNAVYSTRVHQYFIMFGPLAVPVMFWLCWLAWQNRKQIEWRPALLFGPGLLVLLAGIAALIATLVMRDIWPDAAGMRGSIGAGMDMSPGSGWGATVLRRRLVEMPGIAPLLTLVLLLIGGLLRTAKLPFTQADKQSSTISPLRFVLILALTGGLLMIGPEFVYLRDFFGARMNTIFKFYYQAWLLWAIVGAYATWMLLSQVRSVVRFIYLPLAMAVVAAGLVYPFAATYTKTDGFQGTYRPRDVADLDGGVATLDGIAHMQNDCSPGWRGYCQDERMAIEWINANLEDGVIVEAVGGSYTQYARISAHTGLQAVIGWPGHEGQWRGSYDLFGEREGRVKTLYETTNWDEAAQILNDYNVDYVYVGQLEREDFSGAGLDKFANNMTPIYENGVVTIYQWSGEAAGNAN